MPASPGAHRDDNGRWLRRDGEVPRYARLVPMGEDEGQGAEK